MRKVIVLLVCYMFSVVSFCLAADLKAVDHPTIEMLQGTWEGKFARRLASMTSGGEFEMKIKGKKAFITRGSNYTDPATEWVVTIDRIDKGKIFMSSPQTEFELELFTNDRADFFLEGDYTGLKAGTSMRSVNTSIRLRRTSTTIEENKVPVDANKY